MKDERTKKKRQIKYQIFYLISCHHIIYFSIYRILNFLLMKQAEKRHRIKSKTKKKTKKKKKQNLTHHRR